MDDSYWSIGTLSLSFDHKISPRRLIISIIGFIIIGSRVRSLPSPFYFLPTKSFFLRVLPQTHTSLQVHAFIYNSRIWLLPLQLSLVFAKSCLIVNLLEPQLQRWFPHPLYTCLFHVFIKYLPLLALPTYIPCGIFDSFSSCFLPVRLNFNKIVLCRYMKE